jgi:hypothetical protein
MPKYAVVTTFHAKGYEQYAQKFINTYLQSWPKNVNLYVYAEDCKIVESSDNLIVRDLHLSSQPLVDFKNKWKNVPKANGDVSQDPVRSKRRDAGKGFKWDAIRFSHKVYAIFHCAQNCDADILLWMDADMICHSPVTEDVLNSLIPDTADLCFLGRGAKFSECGLYAMNLRSQRITNFLKRFQHFYDDAEKGIFTLDEWHDSFVFDAVRKLHSLIEVDWSKGLITGEGHPLINSAWGAYLDHLKGKRKEYGKSLSTDLVVARNEGYWSKKK